MLHANVIQGVRTHEAPDYIRVVLDTSKASKYSIFELKNPHRIGIEVKGAKPSSGLSLNSTKELTHIKGLRGGRREAVARAHLLKEGEGALPPPALLASRNGSVGCVDTELSGDFGNGRRSHLLAEVPGQWCSLWSIAGSLGCANRCG